MSDKLTRIKLPGNKSVGFQDWGEKTASEMVKTIRGYAATMREMVEAIEKASDDEFQIDVIRGPAVQHFVREVQKSSRASKPNSKGRR